ncbi:hypothetical protein CPC08DRAFT_736847 [Agrocybe pediades]|nr:hypothetical protein CPC08DRAFT_736847 [Agrocybe pediades]
MTMLAPLIEVFRYALQPIAPFTWLGWNLSTLDIVATFRLCIFLRQIRESILKKHISTNGTGSIEQQSFVRTASVTLLLVYGGEAVIAPFLGVPPSFMVSGVVPTLYTVVQAIVEYLPSVPAPSAEVELPLSLFDGFARAYLLCNLIPPAVTTNASPVISSSPWTLLVSSLVIANGGFFMVNLFSFLNPTPLSVQTPPELQPYGWTTLDIWAAPVITGLYALLTHAQPFWADLHAVLAGVLGSASFGEPVKPLDPESARVVCALILSALFAGRTAKNFGLWKNTAPARIEPKEKTQ